MKLKSLYITVLFAAMHLAVFAGPDDTEPQRRKPSDANVHGHVIDARSGEHIPFATVSVEGTTIGVTADATGHFYLKNLPEGELTILAESVGYKARRRKIAARSGKSVEVNFEMSEETLSMDAVVVSATRNETNKKSTAVVVNVASAKLFETTASTNLAESMKFQSGLRVENNCGNCGTMQLRINGLEGQYSQILLDSAPIFSSLAAVYGLEQLPVAMIERVEVIRGGGSALFGSNAIGGVVNIITKEPLRNTLAVSNLTDIIEDGTAEYNTSLNGSFVSDDNRAGIYLFGMIKNRAAYDRNGDGFSDIPQVKSETVGFRGYRGNIYASAQRISRDSYYGTGKDPDAYGKTSDLTAVVGAQYTYSFDKCLFMPAQLTLGGEYTYNDLDDHSIGFDRKLLQTVRTAGAFVQNEWRSDKFNIIVGGRLDKHSMIDKPIFSPRANIRYSPNENVGLRLSYSSGYRAPQAYNEDLHIDALNNQSAVIVLDPDLKPEYSHSLSGSADLYRTFGSVQTNLLVEGFYTDLDDVFTLTKTGEDEAGNIIKMRRNASGATVAGITSELKIGISNAFEVQLGYTFQRSRYDEPERWSDDAEPQRRMFRTPDHYGYMTASADIARNLRASLFGNYTGRMLVQHNAGWIERDTDRLTPAFWDMGLRFSYLFRLTNVITMQLDAGVKNIFDSYQSDLDFGPSKDSVYIYGPSLPRTYFVGLKFTM